MDLTDVKTKKIAKGTLLLEPGEICKSGYKVKSGCLKSYVIDNYGKEHILQFAPEEWLISDLESYIRQTPSKIFIDAVEDSEIHITSRNIIPRFDQMDQETLVQMNQKFINNLIAKNNRLISLLTGTAEERYIEFKEIYPELTQRLPLKLIASYLGMTPEHLSYTRSKLERKP